MLSSAKIARNGVRPFPNSPPKPASGRLLQQSDQANPVMPRAGHLALILPNFARGKPQPGSIGMYEFLGKWQVGRS
jgi:hypothetical protein